MKKIKNIAIGLLALASFTACDRDNNHPGFTYYPDMAYSQAYDAYSENPLFDDNKTLREPVEGTIARGHIPYPYEKNDEDRAKAGMLLVNPYNASGEVLARGKERYTMYCAMCHGDLGDGQGHLYTSNRYPFPPASLINEKMQNTPDGEFFHVITVGHGIMGPHATIVREEDRWKITQYIKSELMKDAP